MIGCAMTTTSPSRPAPYGPPAPRRAGTVPPRTIDDMLADSLIRTIMRADRVDPAELEATLRRVARNLARQRGAS